MKMQTGDIITAAGTTLVVVYRAGRVPRIVKKIRGTGASTERKARQWAANARIRLLNSQLQD